MAQPRASTLSIPTIPTKIKARKNDTADGTGYGQCRVGPCGQCTTNDFAPNFKGLKEEDRRQAIVDF